jgi:hypothetical protein
MQGATCPASIAALALPDPDDDISLSARGRIAPDAILGPWCPSPPWGSVDRRGARLGRGVPAPVLARPAGFGGAEMPSAEVPTPQLGDPPAIVYGRHRGPRLRARWLGAFAGSLRSPAFPCADVSTWADTGTTHTYPPHGKGRRGAASTASRDESANRPDGPGASLPRIDPARQAFPATAWPDLRAAFPSPEADASFSILGHRDPEVRTTVHEAWLRSGGFP